MGLEVRFVFWNVTVMNFRPILPWLALALLSLVFFAQSGCSEAAGSGVNVAIPRVLINCTTANCMTNATAPRMNVIITSSGCTSPFFGAVVSTSTRAINCNGTLGCQGEFSGWVDKSGSLASTLPAGTYSICGCIDYQASSTPFVKCDSSGSKDNVSISSGTGLQSISSWHD